MSASTRPSLYARYGTLTDRMHEAVMLAAEGHTARTAAEVLGVTESGVADTLNRARIETGARNTVHLVAKVVRAERDRAAMVARNAVSAAEVARREARAARHAAVEAEDRVRRLEAGPAHRGRLRAGEWYPPCVAPGCPALVSGYSLAPEVGLCPVHTADPTAPPVADDLAPYLVDTEDALARELHASGYGPEPSPRGPYEYSARRATRLRAEWERIVAPDDDEDELVTTESETAA